MSRISRGNGRKGEGLGKVIVKRCCSYLLILRSARLVILLVRYLVFIFVRERAYMPVTLLL